MQDASAKVDFRQSNAVSIKKPIPRRAQPQPDEAVAQQMGSVLALQHPSSDNPAQSSHGAIAAPWPILRLPDNTGTDAVQYNGYRDAIMRELTPIFLISFSVLSFPPVHFLRLIALRNQI